MSSSKRIAVEGWRLFPHRYAIVNQWQTLSFLKQAHTVHFHDLPWQGAKPPDIFGIFSGEDEKALCALPSVSAGERYDLCLRIAHPFNLSERCVSGAEVNRLLVLGTAEHQFLTDDNFTAKPNLARLNASDSFLVVTPSAWSRNGFLKLGLSEDRIRVVPHGADLSTFNNSRTQREGVRKHFALPGFTFLHCGAMTKNKGVDVLLKAFRILIEKYPEARLVLKGMDQLYGSKDRVFSYLKELDHDGQRKAAARLIYIGNVLSMNVMADIYSAADMYVSPYRAEDFNLPVLEAMACGLPILCSKGGPTDEFVADTFCRKIDSTLNENAGHCWLEPDLDHLVALMEQAIGDDALKASALVQGPAFVARDHSWDKIAQKLTALA